MINLQEHKTYILSILEKVIDYFHLPEIDIKFIYIDNTGLFIRNNKIAYLQFNLSNLHYQYTSQDWLLYFRNRYSPLRKLFFKKYLLLVLLHEIKHLQQWIKDKENFMKNYKNEALIVPHDRISYEIEADKFAKEKYREVILHTKKRLRYETVS